MLSSVSLAAASLPVLLEGSKEKHISIVSHEMGLPGGFTVLRPYGPNLLRAMMCFAPVANDVRSQAAPGSA